MAKKRGQIYLLNGIGYRHAREKGTDLFTERDRLSPGSTLPPMYDLIRIIGLTAFFSVKMPVATTSSAAQQGRLPIRGCTTKKNVTTMFRMWWLRTLKKILDSPVGVAAVYTRPVCNLSRKYPNCPI